MERQIEVFEAAHRRLLTKLIKNGLEIRNLAFINKKRYCLVFGKEKNILITFKRDLFHNFGSMFIDKDCFEEGDTINYEELKQALNHDVKEIYTILPDETTYKIPILKFLEKSKSWVNKSGKEVRSVSINEYKKVFEV